MSDTESGLSLKHYNVTLKVIEANFRSKNIWESTVSVSCEGTTHTFVLRSDSFDEAVAAGATEAKLFMDHPPTLKT